ncbi:MAG TPA: hypothetical protein VK814_00575 [Acidobacteriaceae bacterium]|nr:hypothetical protein [Acidobacteriaceae bacterium]
MIRKRITLFFLSIVTLLALSAGNSTAQDLRPGPNITGNWTIYAYNVDKPGGSLKTIQVTQNGNIIPGIFHGPHQHGKFQGWINGNHIEFSTDTRDVLTFRGEISPQGMSGLYGVHGRHAPWRAERTNQ